MNNKLINSKYGYDKPKNAIGRKFLGGIYGAIYDVAKRSNDIMFIIKRNF